MPYKSKLVLSAIFLEQIAQIKWNPTGRKELAYGLGLLISQKMYFLLCHTVSEVMRGLLIFLALSKSALINEGSNRRNPLEVISCQDSREIINLQFQLFFFPLSLLVGPPCTNLRLNSLVQKEKVLWERGWWCLGRGSQILKWAQHICMQIPLYYLLIL